MSDLSDRILTAAAARIIERQACADTGAPLSARDYARAAAISTLRTLANSRGTGGLWIHSVADGIEGKP